MAEQHIHRKQFLLAAGAVFAGLAGLGKLVWTGRRSTAEQAGDSHVTVQLRQDPRSVTRSDRV